MDIRKFFGSSKKESTKVVEYSPITYKVYTDGSTFNNGKKNAIGGIGVYFPHKKLDNISEPFTDDLATNNKCELEACRQALLSITSFKEFNRDDFIILYTDSSYLINCITLWSNTWEKNGWKRLGRSGKKVQVKNIDLIKQIKSLYKMYRIEFRHIMAHKDAPNSNKNSTEYLDWYGNKMADELAVLGTKKNL
tara:strand:+ start:72 stop:650 length:579 start_codon:yes stop_codon:yes gene_type:complete